MNGSSWCRPRSLGSSETPTGLFAEETLVLPELIGLVHREGSDTPHPALQAWQLGMTYRLRDITSLTRLV